MRRILTAFVGLPILFVVIKYLPPRWFMGMVAISVVVGSYELYALAERRGLRPHKLLGSALGVAVAYTFFDPRLEALDVLCLAAILVPVASLVRAGWRGARPEHEIGSMAVTLHAVLFVGLLMGYSLALLDDGGEMGRDLTVLLFWVVWLSDAGAYTIGSLAGRHPLMPSVSPRKTVEGALGAIAVGVGSALVARAWFFHRLRLSDALVLGVVLASIGMVGDLAESLMKRSAGIKDSGRLFPGHGGMLDRTDSLLFAAPVLFYYHKYFMM